MSRSAAIAVRVVIALLLLVGAAVWLHASTPPETAQPALEPLPLTAASCPEEAVHAAHAARAALKAANARMQRYAFAPREGLLALDQLAIAMECARVVGDGALEASASTQRAELHGRIEGDAQNRFRRYEVLKRHGRLREAGPDVAYLVALGWPERGTLADQLRRDRDVIAGNAAGAER